MKTSQWKFKVVYAILNGLFFIVLSWLFSYFIGDKEYSSNIGHLLFQGAFFGVFMGIVYPYILGKLGIKFLSSKTDKQ